MTKYSNADLLNEESDEGFLDKVIRRLSNSKEVPLEIHVPDTLHFRAEIFCNDIEDLSNVDFKQYDLIASLYYDFLSFCKENPSLNVIYNKLLTLESKTVPIHAYNKDPAKKNLSKIVKEVREKKGGRGSVVAMEVKFHRREVLRGEVLLADLNGIYPQHQFTLERILELLYCDFVVKVRRGEGEDAIKSIVKSLIND